MRIVERIDIDEPSARASRMEIVEPILNSPKML
jgi:hypothetical protein